MRVGIVTGEYPPMQGGIGAYTYILAKEMVIQGAEVAIFSSTKAQGSSDTISVTNAAKTWNITSVRGIHRWAKEHQIDVLNIQFQTAAYGMSPWIHFLPQLTTIPVVTTFHDLRHPYLFPKAGRLRDWIVMHLAKHSKGVIVTNQEDCLKVYGLPQTKLIPIGSNIQQALPNEYDVSNWRTKSGAKGGDFLIGYFGLFNQTKGLETLIDSIKHLQDAGHSVRLVMIGGGLGSGDPTNSVYLETLKQQIKRLELEKLIHWTGYLEHEWEVGAYLSACDTVAMPFIDGASYRRGSLMAAIQYSCAIVSTIPTVDIPTFRSGENMMLVPAQDTQSLSQMLDKLRMSSDLRERLKQGAYALRKEFSWDTIAAETLAFFDQVRKS